VTGPNEGGIDWDNPIGGQPVQDVSAIPGVVGFSIVVPPKSLGDLVGVYATPATDGGLGAVDFVYDLDRGRVVVGEGLWDFPPDHWREWVDSVVATSDAAALRTPSPSEGSEIVFGSAQTYALANGRLGLLTTSEDGKQSDIQWPEPSGVQVVVQGPNLSVDHATEIAQEIAASL